MYIWRKRHWEKQNELEGRKYKRRSTRYLHLRSKNHVGVFKFEKFPIFLLALQIKENFMLNLVILKKKYLGFANKNWLLKRFVRIVRGSANLIFWIWRSPFSLDHRKHIIQYFSINTFLCCMIWNKTWKLIKSSYFCRASKRSITTGNFILFLSKNQ